MTPPARSQPGFYQFDTPKSTRMPRPIVEAAIEESLIQCNKTALVDSASKLNSEMEHLTLHYPWLPFVRSKDRLYNIHVVWYFTKPEHSKLPRIFRILVESGIYHSLQRFNTRGIYFERAKFTRNITREIWERVKPIKITDNIQTIYYICLCCICVACLGFFGEVSINGYMYLVGIMLRLKKLVSRVAVDTSRVLLLQLKYFKKALFKNNKPQQ